MGVVKKAKARAAHTAKTVLGRKSPGRFGVRRHVGMLDDYEVADLIEVDGKIPLNYFTYRPNFGDLLSPWLVKKMTGKDVEVADRSQPHYVVIGSIINQGTDKSVIWGSGTYGTEGKNEVNAQARYTAVRGPITRAKLSASKGFGIRVPAVYGDPALLLPLYYMPKVKITHDYGVVVRWSERAWAKATYGPGVKMIDLSRTDIEGVIDEMLSCRKIISSSLHGLIVADAYGVPNAWLASDSPRGGEYKFHDYFASVQKLRLAQPFDPTAGPVTKATIDKNFVFSGESITFNYRPLLDACPFLKRKSSAEDGVTPGSWSRESGAQIRNLSGTSTLLPSLGYFGGIAANYLPVRFDALVSEIRFHLPHSSAGQLDLRGIELLRKGRRIEIDDAKTVVKQSSNAISPEKQRSPFSFGGIRTKSEKGAWYTIRFTNPVNADELRVYNRVDGYGIRSRALTVDVVTLGAEVVARESVDSDRVIKQTFRLIAEITGRTIKNADLESKESARELRDQVMRDLAERAQQGLLTSDASEQRLLAALIPTAKPNPAISYTDEEWALVGQFLAAERLRISRTATSMRSFQLMLPNRDELRRFEQEVNAAVEIVGGSRLVLTRHGFTAQSALRTESDDYMMLIARATETLAECGYPAMLAYGTLLGYVREGNFLEHDDDIDMLVPFAAESWESAQAEVEALRQELTSRGWRITRPNSYTNFHMVDVKSGLHLDVFPVVMVGDQANLHMEKMAVRAIDADIVMPPQQVDFNGRQVWVPAKPAEFLEARYGSGWSSTDKFYDWPWKLAED